MRAVILVGGLGTRLRPLTLTTPKQMLPVAEVTMIERVLTHLAGHGVDEVVLSVGYRPDAFLAAFPEDRCAGVALRYAVEHTALDTGGAIGFAARQAGIDETFLVVNGDVLTDLDVGALAAAHRRAGGAATIALTPVADPSAFGVVPTAADGRVTAFIEKPPPGQAPTNLINAGFYVLEPSVLEAIPTEGRVNVERETFPALVAAGALYAEASDAYWIDTGSPASYLRANLDHLAGLRGEPPAPGARRDADGGAWVLGHPVLDAAPEAGSLVGDAAFVARGSTVSASIVGAGARVDRAHIRGSVLLPGAVVHAGAVVEDSICGPGSVVGEGATLRNLTVLGGAAAVEAGAVLDGAAVAAP